MKKLASILTIVSVLFGLIAESLPMNYEYLYGVLWVLSFTFTSIAFFLYVSYSDIFLKTITFTLSVCCVINFLGQVFIGFDNWDRSLTCVALYTCFIATYAIQAAKPYHTSKEHDKVESTGVYIVFKKPKDFLGFLFCLWIPVSSVSVVVDMIQFRFKKGEGFDNDLFINSNRFIAIKVNLNSIETINKLLPIVKEKRKWSPRYNCCHVVKELFPNQKFSVLTYLPCFLLTAIKKGQKNA